MRRVRRDSPIPIMISLVIAGAAHLVAATPAARWLTAARQAPTPADLRVENLIVPDDLLRLTQPNAVGFDVVNRGMQSIGDDLIWQDRIHLSLDDRWDRKDQLLATHTQTGPLEPGRGYRVQVPALTLPPGVRPPFYLLFETDAQDAVDEGLQERNNLRAMRFDPAADPQQPQLAVGKPDAPPRVTVAWISHEDFQKLIAPKSETEQPAIQNVVEPIPAAPLEMDPTPPQMQPSPDDPRAAAQPGGSLASSSLPADAPAAPPLPPATDSVVTPAATATAAQVSAAPRDIHQTPGPGDSAADADPASDQEPTQPTATPRDQGEADPAQRYPTRLDVQPGGTITGPGIEIKTTRPRFSAVARASTIPDDPEAELTFDAAGSVVNAVITRSSGSANVDAPILRSFYQWKASGPRIDQLGDSRLILPVRLILRE